jgi:hypothetical protein
VVIGAKLGKFGPDTGATMTSEVPLANLAFPLPTPARAAPDVDVMRHHIILTSDFGSAQAGRHAQSRP